MKLTSRRLFLGAGLGAAVAAVAGAIGAELVDHDVLPGKSELDALDGACELPPAGLDVYAAPGRQMSGRFHSAARNRSVGYTIGYPPGHGPGDVLPLVIVLHGEGNDHANRRDGDLHGLDTAPCCSRRSIRVSSARSPRSVPRSGRATPRRGR